MAIQYVKLCEEFNKTYYKYMWEAASLIGPTHQNK